MPLTTFGFELEFEAGAPEVAQHLYSNHGDLIGSDNLHSYHCDCETCDLNGDDPFLLRAQNDSSCSGELISSVLDHIDQARPVFEAVQEAAWEVDAVPGMNSGMHVHVGMANWRYTSSDRMPQAEMFYQWLRWEKVFAKIGQGRFDQMRGFNQTKRDQFSYQIERGFYWGDDSHRNRNIDKFYLGGWSAWFEAVESLEREVRDNLLLEMIQVSREHDRHSFLATHTRHNTWEFRLWNSTRVAWRMELFVELSRLFVSPEFNDRLAGISYGEDPEKNDPIKAIPSLLEIMPDRVRPLLERQLNWLEQVENELVPYSNELTVI